MVAENPFKRCIFVKLVRNLSLLKQTLVSKNKKEASSSYSALKFLLCCLEGIYYRNEWADSYYTKVQNIISKPSKISWFRYADSSSSGKCLSGKCPSGKCQSGICPRGSVSRRSVRSGNCPTIVSLNSKGHSLS